LSNNRRLSCLSRGSRPIRVEAAHCWCVPSSGAVRVLRSFASAGRARRLAGLVALPSCLPSRPSFLFSPDEGPRQTARRTALGQDLGPVGLMRHRPALNRRRPPGSSARLCSPESHVGDTNRPRQAPLLGLVSLQRNPAALRCPGMPSSRTIPLRCCGWPRPSAQLRSVEPNPRVPVRSLLRFPAWRDRQ
jgi:hypothetical protein